MCGAFSGLLKIYSLYVLDFDPPVCLEKMIPHCGGNEELATAVSKYWENKLMQGIKKRVDPHFKKKLNRKQVGVAMVGFLENDFDFVARGLEAYR